MQIRWKPVTLTILVSWLTLLSVSAAEFPILGVFGDPKNQGCKSYRAEEEGAYVGFNKGGNTGENGEGSCYYKKIEILPKSTYRLTGRCSSLEGEPANKKSTLVVIDNDQIFYDGTRYVRCH